MLGTKSKAVLIKPSGSKKVKVVIDYPVQKEVPKAEAKFLDKCALKKYKFINAGNQHLIIETKKVFSFDLDELSSKLRKRKFFAGVNISLFSKQSKSLELRTNEAGAGETLSCGSASAGLSLERIRQK